MSTSVIKTNHLHASACRLWAKNSINYSLRSVRHSNCRVQYTTRSIPCSPAMVWTIRNISTQVRVLSVKTRIVSTSGKEARPCRPFKHDTSLKVGALSRVIRTNSGHVNVLANTTRELTGTWVMARKEPLLHSTWGRMPLGCP